MKRYIRQKAFSWGDKFRIFDAQGEDLYFVKGEVFSWGKKLHLYKDEENELAFIHQKVFAFMPTYYFDIPGRCTCEVVKKFTFLHPEYLVSVLGWKVTGNITGHEYEILSGDKTLVTVSKKWFTFGGSYEIDISPEADELAALCVVLIIDAVLAAQSSASSGNN